MVSNQYLVHRIFLGISPIVARRPPWESAPHRNPMALSDEPLGVGYVPAPVGRSAALRQSELHWRGHRRLLVERWMVRALLFSVAFVSLYLQNYLGFSAFNAGLRTLPLSG